MWWERDGEEVVKAVIAKATGVRQGVEQLLGYFAGRCQNPVWQRMARLDFEGDSDSVEKWISAQLPIPNEVAVLWFAFKDVTCGFDLRGSSNWSNDPDDWQWTYKADFHGKSYESPVLIGMHQLAREVEDPQEDVSEGGVWELTDYLFTIGYVGLAIAQSLRSIKCGDILGNRTDRWAVTGFPDAVDGIIIGNVNSNGFTPFMR